MMIYEFDNQVYIKKFCFSIMIVCILNYKKYGDTCELTT
jgi:hypothetical protein